MTNGFFDSLAECQQHINVLKQAGWVVPPHYYIQEAIFKSGGIPTARLVAPTPRSPKTKLVVTFPDGTVFDDNRSVDTFVKTIQKIGFDNVAKVGISIKGYNLVDTRQRTDTGCCWQKQVGNYYIYTNLANIKKARFLKQISDFYNLELKIETK